MCCTAVPRLFRATLLLQIASLTAVAWSVGATPLQAVSRSAVRTTPQPPVRTTPQPTVPTTQQPQEGRITGRVVDAGTGQGLTNVEVTIVGTTLVSRSDLDGRYTIVRVPAGPKSVVARRIGRQPKRFDGVVVTAGEAAIVNFTLGEVSVELQSIVVTAAATDRSATEASLLAAQQRAASASDGVSAEQIKRTPDSNAGEAAARVSGVSIVDGKFLVARGLSERYSTTLLNGAEVASPEPTRKLVPLDVFPASLLESIVVTKSATPDKPGDFSGGAVEIKTKEFPENTIRQFTISQGYNSQATFQNLRFPERTGMDYLGIDNGKRAPSFRPPTAALKDPFVVEQFAEGIRNTWNPKVARVLPKLGLSATVGGQRPSENVQLGYVFSLTYSSAAERLADRFFGFYSAPDSPAERGYVYQDSKNTVDWGAVGNLSLRLGKNAKLGWKNLYTRNAEELYSESVGFNADLTGDLRQYQFQYVERNLVQSQLAGEHLLPSLNSSRLEWKATVGQSGRNEPDNRQVRYGRSEGSGDPFQLLRNNDTWMRTLDDQTRSAQVDLTVPLRFLWTDFSFKTGALARTKRRKFNGELFTFSPSFTASLPNDLRSLPPELVFQPENIGSLLVLTAPGGVAQPYDADDDITAAYGMLDLFFGGKLRLVTGARLEDWRVDLFDGGRARFAVGDSTLQPTRRRNRDVLLSANATYALSERANFRVAAFQSVSRPDTRELSRDEYTEIAGSCSTIGNPDLQRGRVSNADARLEWYPRPGEVFSASGFYKRFANPIIRVVDARNQCTYGIANAASAENLGGELEMRKDLTFLPSVFVGLSLSLNVTLVRSSVTISPRFGNYDAGLDLEGQSPYVVNAGLAYTSRKGGLSASVLYNAFGNRVLRYGFASSGGANAKQGPNILERGRSSLDAKVQRVFSERFSMSASAKNLTNQRVQFFQIVATGEESTGRATPGVSFDLGVSIAR